MALAPALQLTAGSPYTGTQRDQYHWDGVWDGGAKRVTIHRDKYGVPRVYDRCRSRSVSYHHPGDRK